MSCAFSTSVRLRFACTHCICTASVADTVKRSEVILVFSQDHGMHLVIVFECKMAGVVGTRMHWWTS